MLGENGTGKTTFIRMLAGMTAPDAGSTEDGQELPSFNVRWAALFYLGNHLTFTCYCTCGVSRLGRFMVQVAVFFDGFPARGGDAALGMFRAGKHEVKRGRLFSVEPARAVRRLFVETWAMGGPHCMTPTVWCAPSCSYKPQKISPKFEGTVRQLLHKKIRESYLHPQVRVFGLLFSYCSWRSVS